MGSSGTGRFGDYYGGGNAGSISGNTNTGVDGDSWPRELLQIKLEDIEHLEYYLNNSSVPESGHLVQIRDSLYNGRVVVQSAVTLEIIGNIPTRYNYIFFNCVTNGINYSGEVLSSDLTPIPFVVVNLYAE